MSELLTLLGLISTLDWIIGVTVCPVTDTDRGAVAEVPGKTGQAGQGEGGHGEENQT